MRSRAQTVPGCEGVTGTEMRGERLPERELRARAQLGPGCKGLAGAEVRGRRKENMDAEIAREAKIMLSLWTAPTSSF